MPMNHLTKGFIVITLTGTLLLIILYHQYNPSHLPGLGKGLKDDYRILYHQYNPSHLPGLGKGQKDDYRLLYHQYNPSRLPGLGKGLKDDEEFYSKQNASITSQETLTERTSQRGTTTTSSVKDVNTYMKSNFTIKTILKSPMTAISRNIIDRYYEYRQIKQVTDFKKLYDSRFSLVELITAHDALTVGSKLRVRISLYNGYNHSLTQGGDLLNIWLRNKDGNSTVAGYVVDNLNGTYTGHVMAFWAGNVTIKVTVTNTKEGIGLYTNYVQEHGSYKFINATFVEGNIGEITQCAPTMSHWLRHQYGGFCNLTEENYNIPLFCGKPKTVSCTNWVKYGWDDSLYYDENTKKILGYKDIVLKPIHLTIVPSSKEDLYFPIPKVPCNKLPPSLTWNSTVPSGFLFKGKYHNLLCQTTVDSTKENYRTCLKNLTVILIGDSTTRQWFLRLSSILGIRDSTNIPEKGVWQKYAHAQSPRLGLDIEWQPHELPFHGTPGSDRKNIKSVSFRLDEIPAKSNAIVIIHWYGHIARCCDHIALREHVRAAKVSIVKLLKRSPDVQVFIKGPHLITYFYARKPYAYIGMFVEQVLLEEFKDLTDKIIYLDQWDMSVAKENVNIHPEPLLDDISLNNLINFACNTL